VTSEIRVHQRYEKFRFGDGEEWKNIATVFQFDHFSYAIILDKLNR